MFVSLIADVPSQLMRFLFTKFKSARERSADDSELDGAAEDSEIGRLHSMRQKLLQQQYPCHSRCKNVAWCLLLVLIMCFTSTTVVTAAQFGVEYDTIQIREQPQL